MHLTHEEITNRLPAAVFMKISGKSADRENSFVAPQVDLLLTLRFGQQRVDLNDEEGGKAGTVRFGRSSLLPITSRYSS